MVRSDPFLGRRSLKEMTLLAPRWCCPNLMSCRGVYDTPTGLWIKLDAASIHCWVWSFASKIRNRPLNRYRSWRSLTEHGNELCAWANGVRFDRWRAVDLSWHLIDFRLTKRRDAKVASAVLRQAREIVSRYEAQFVITEKAPPTAKVIEGINEQLGQADANQSHFTEKRVNNGIVRGQADLKQILCPMCGFRDMSSAIATVERSETFRAMRRAEFDGATKGVPNEIAFAENLLKAAA